MGENLIMSEEKTDQGIFDRMTEGERLAENTASKLLAEFERDAGNDRESLVVLARVCAEVVHRILSHKLRDADPLWVLMVQGWRLTNNERLWLLVQQVDKPYEGAGLPDPPWSIEPVGHPPVSCWPVKEFMDDEQVSEKPTVARGLCVLFDGAEKLGDDIAADAFEKFVIDNAQLLEGRSVAAISENERK